MNYLLAKAISDAIESDMATLVETVVTAGEIRRELEEISKISIVCIPNKVEPAPTLSTDYAGEVVDPEFIAFVKSLGRQVSGSVTGRRVGIVIPELIEVDIFMPQPADFYRILALQTGSNDYCNNVIGPAWEALGWCDTEHGLRKIVDCRYSGYRYKWVNTAGDVPTAWASEEAFFEWLEVDYVAPNER